MSRIKKTTSSKITEKKHHVEEILRCGRDPHYFINTYVRIPHPKKGRLQFKTFPYQDKCLQEFIDHNKIIINKSRQLGLSTLAAAYALWMGIFQRDRNILVIATKLETAKNFLNKVKTGFEGLPKWLVLPSIVVETKTELHFSNGSKVKAIPTSQDAGRSEALSLLVIDECAWIEGIDHLWVGLQPTLSTGGSVILISSPSGVGTFFHNMWVEANTEQNEKGEGNNGFFPIELPWTVHPERDEAWFNAQKAALMPAGGERAVAQELLCQFGSSGHTFISSDTMDSLFLGIQEPKEKLTVNFNSEIWIWKYPTPEHKYVIGADVASGQSDDKSAFHIIDTNEDEVVAEFAGKITPDKFAHVLVEWAVRYNMATICQELNNHGQLTAHVLKETKYPNLYYEKKAKNLYSSYVTENNDDQPGFTTNPTTRDEILIRLENALRNKHLRVYSKRLFSELQTFIYKKNSISGKEKVQARKGCNDDLVMSLAIACNMFEASGKSSFENNSESQWALVRGMSRNTQKFDTNTGMTSDGFFSLPKTEAPKNSLDLHIEKQKVESLKHSSQQDFNSPFWKQWGWVYKG